jgi:predicted ester cyclase
MSTEQNKATVRRWFGEIVNGHTPLPILMQTLEETFAPAFVDHDGPDPQHGREALKRALPGLLQACPDAHLIIEHLIGEDDMVAVRLRGQATHTGRVGSIAPTGKRIEWTENEILRFGDGRIVESWGEGTLDQALEEIGLTFAGAGRGAPADQVSD